MKTAEERVREKFSWSKIKEKYLKFHHIDKFTENMAIDIDFGYWLANDVIDEAMRWRNPDEELPTAGEPVVVKYRTAKNVEKHGIGKYFNLGIGNPWTIEGSTGREVIGWRPIE